MAKGNIFMGTVKGRIGDTVMYVQQGQQGMMKYQPNITNPKTGRQMYQRARFSNAGRFFTRGQQNFYKFAFEGKKRGVSDFNAFMQANINRSVLISKSALWVEGYPAIGKFIMSRGTLSSVTCRVTNDYWQAHFGIVNWDTNPTTVGELASLLIATGEYLRDDILTFVYLNTTGSGYIPSVKPTGDYHTEWTIKQFRLRPEDSTPLSNYEMRAVSRVWGGVAYMTLTDVEDSQILYSTDSAFTVVHSRNTSAGLKVSTQELALGETMLIAYNECQTDEYKEQVIADWQTTDEVQVAPEAILQGSRSFVPKASTGVTINPNEGSPFTINGITVTSHTKLVVNDLYDVCLLISTGLKANALRAVSVDGSEVANFEFLELMDNEVQVDIRVTTAFEGNKFYTIEQNVDGIWTPIARVAFYVNSEQVWDVDDNPFQMTINPGSTSSIDDMDFSPAIPTTVGDYISALFEFSLENSSESNQVRLNTDVIGTGDSNIAWSLPSGGQSITDRLNVTDGKANVGSNQLSLLFLEIKNDRTTPVTVITHLLSLDVVHADGTKDTYIFS